MILREYLKLRYYEKT